MIKEKNNLFYHPFEFPYGIKVDGHVDSYKKMELLEFPTDFKESSVIDIGCNLGFFLHQARKRNAGRLVGIEVNKQNYDLAVEIEENIFKSEIEFYNYSYPEQDHLLKEQTFDYGIIMAVLHYMNNPHRVIEKISKRIKKELIIEAVVEGYWGKNKFTLRDKYFDIVPSEQCMEWILKKHFKKVEKIGKSISPRQSNQNRVIWKAYK